LKVYYPAEFMAAVISNGGGFYSAFAYVSEARRLGLSILPPDVNESDICWIGKDAGIRVGLRSIKGLSEETRDRMVSERCLNPYRSLKDFWERVRPQDDETSALIQCGAFDSLYPKPNRTAMMWELAFWQKSKSNKPANRTLFNHVLHNAPPALPPEKERDRLRREFAVLGFLCDRHPMILYRDALQHIRTVRAIDLSRHIGKRVVLAGWLITGKVVYTKKGDLMEFLTFEDESGIVETTFFPETYRRFCHMIDRGRPYLLSGSVDRDWGAVTLTVDKVERIPADSFNRHSTTPNP
jgi:DNA polymerase-3 subunit alpha/error-prone DNA polymerase